MNTDLTDAEWALVADLFERDGQRGAPPRFGRRLMAHHDRSNWAPLAWVWLAEARILATRLAT